MNGDGCSSTCDDENIPTSNQCMDGIQNGSETGVDCGGTCQACTSCIDGVQNGAET